MTRSVASLLVVVLAACGSPVATTSGGAAQAEPIPAGDASTVTRDPAGVADPGATELVALAGGEYEPLFPGRDAPKTLAMAGFRLERLPVSNAQFLAFVAAVPKWRRDRAPGLFVDANYLSHWLGPLRVEQAQLDRPVTNVSWFAARAYARWRQRRLPTTSEWEYAGAMPLADGRDASRAILEWYGQPGGLELGPVGSGMVTSAGISDLHGLVWEWVEDFSSAMVSGDARSDTDLQRALFCGAGAIGSARPEDYAAFMRYAMRSSLKGVSTTRNLGFRCAQDLERPSGVKK